MILLDTHVLVWWTNDDHRRLSAAALNAIASEAQNGRILVSSITAWEIAMLVERGRLVLSMDVSGWLSIVHAIDVVEFIAVDHEIAVRSVQLPGAFHNDPADRIIVATARQFGAAIVTADEKIRAYPHVRAIW